MDTSHEGVTIPAQSDLSLRAARRRATQWADAKVADAMSRPVLTIEASETLSDAWALLSISGLRRLVVVDDGRCVGVLSDRMILTDVPLSLEALGQRTVGNLLGNAALRPVREGDPLSEVAHIMARHSEEAVPVIDQQGRPLGIVTGSDLVRWWADDDL